MTARKSNPEPNNPLGMDGIEFIEYASPQPEALGPVLQSLGFVPVARHRSREVVKGAPALGDRVENPTRAPSASS